MPDHPYRPSAQVFSPDCVFPLTQELGPPQGEIPNLSWTRPAGAPEDGDRAVTGLELGFPIFSPEANYVTSLSFKPHIILALQGSTEVMHGKHLSKRLAPKMHVLLQVCYIHHSTKGPCSYPK